MPGLTLIGIIGGVALVLLIIIIAVAVVVSKKNSDGSDSKTSGLGGISPSSIPSGAPSWLDPFQWQDTTDFNLTYTAQTVGDLPVMGLLSSWEYVAYPLVVHASDGANGDTTATRKLPTTVSRP